jgi:hypothetical protein
MDLDPNAEPDHAIFIIDLQDANKKLIFKKVFCILLFKGTFISFLKTKSKKEVKNSRNKGFSYYFCLLIEGCGSKPLTNRSGSGSRRSKNMWIRWIRIRIRKPPTLISGSCYDCSMLICYDNC